MSDPQQFVDDTEYAAKCLFSGIEGYWRRITETKNEIARFQEFAESHQKEADRTPKALQGPFSYADLFVTLSKDNLRKAKESKRDLELLNQEIADQSMALATLSGGILQIAKQAIATTYGAPANCPVTRQVAGLPLGQVIWQARNQAMHFEDTSFTNPVKHVFTALENTYGEQFSLSANVGTNLAFRVVDVIGWHDYQDYLSDIALLLGLNLPTRE